MASNLDVLPLPSQKGWIVTNSYSMIPAFIGIGISLDVLLSNSFIIWLINTFISFASGGIYTICLVNESSTIFWPSRYVALAFKFFPITKLCTLNIKSSVILLLVSASLFKYIKAL